MNRYEVRGVGEGGGETGIKYGEAIAVRLIVAFFGVTAQNHGLKFYGGGVDAADRINAL